MSSGDCLFFSATVIVATVVWVYIGRKWKFSVLALAMYFPTVAAVLFADDMHSFVIQCLGFNKVTTSIQYSLLGAVAAVAIVSICAVLDLAAGWAKNEDSSASSIHDHNKSVWGFVRAAGEEIGWRCFLLPCLMSRYSPCSALFISGIVWGLFHVPVMLLLSVRLKPPRPWLTILVQFTSVALAAFPHGWLAIQSNYALWASTMMHFVWNKVNPIVLGSIYTQTPGWLAGPQWLINGEGFSGCVIMFPVAVLCCWALQ
ncbi:hypothetical protein ScPMuIL_000785 [Solemya velum]